jgi:hypothetical protein
MHVSLLLNYQFLSTGLLLESSRSNVEFIKVDSLSPFLFNIAVEGQRATIETWRVFYSTLLSFAGRICLIKNVLNSLPIYFKSIFLMPKGVYKILNSIQRRFLWAGVTKQRAIYKVQWKVVIREWKGRFGNRLAFGKEQSHTFQVFVEAKVNI